MNLQKNIDTDISLFKEFYNKISGSPIQFSLKPYMTILKRIRKINLRKSDNIDLKKRSEDLKKKALEGEPLDNLLESAFSIVIEAFRRLKKIELYDVQILSGIALHRGKLIQMQTGEGKTFAAVLPAYLNGLTGKGVHIITANDYLAKRDSLWMKEIFDLLGLSSAYISEGMGYKKRHSSYNADITYLSANEAGFDFLKDNIAKDISNTVQRPFNYVIVDEADFILIDEARVPLVIAGKREEPEIDHRRISGIVKGLDPDDYKTDENERNINVTETGINKVESILKCGNLFNKENKLIFSALNTMLHSEKLLHKNIDYIVIGNKIELIDEFTGRIAENRKWPHGIQNAIEAKEGLSINPEGKVLASITIQHFLKLYPKLCGMTATAISAAEEFRSIYGVKVVVIPPNRPSIRIDEDDVIFSGKKDKFYSIVKEIEKTTHTGRPVLVGTGSVEESEQLSEMLKKSGITCNVLNAKNHEAEAEIIKKAGMLNSVTISTNMAGRGTDIVLGGPDKRSRDKIVSLGGLYVIGTNRHESVRIDDQLRGRAGRQGDPGSTRFFISLEDDLMSRYGLSSLYSRRSLNTDKSNQIKDPLVQKDIIHYQKVIEGENFEIRKTLWKYSNLVEEQRKIINRFRNSVLKSDKELTFLAENTPGMYKKYNSLYGKELINHIERDLTLFFIDSYWAEYLEQITDIKEGIHLHRYGGKSPISEFQQRITRTFNDINEKIGSEIIETFKRVKISSDGIDMVKEGLRGPSSTWTYLINDNPFSTMGISLIGERNMGMAAGAGFLAVIYSPLIFLVFIIKKIVAKFREQKP
ncbi:MAG: accessory Sec system translocase SecA2 [Acidobacteriota bacterium]